MRKTKQEIPEELRQKVFERDGRRCRYCGDLTGPFQADHVYPESKGGITCAENLVTACRRCNNTKHSKLGIWPKPIGYFEELQKIETKHRIRIEQVELEYQLELKNLNSTVLTEREDAVRQFINQKAHIENIPLAIVAILGFLVGLIMFMLIASNLLGLQSDHTKSLGVSIVWVLSFIEVFFIGLWIGRVVYLGRNTRRANEE